MIAIILSLNRRKESSLEEDTLPSLSYRHAAQGTGVRPWGTGCCGESSRGHLPDGLLPPIRVKSFVSKNLSPQKGGIQPHLPVRLPCYTPSPPYPPHLRRLPLGWAGDFGCRRLGGVTGGVQGPGTHSPRHADPRLLATPTSWGGLQPAIRTGAGFPGSASRGGILCTGHCSTCSLGHRGA